MLEVIILAAGRGTRMRSKRPKVLHPLAGKPLLGHVVDAARALSPEKIHVVVGFGGAQVEAAFADQPDLEFHAQSEQLGTGHAVLQALPACASDSTVLVLYGDVPLMSVSTLKGLIAKVNDAPALLTTLLENPHGYGRVIRSQDGSFAEVVEQKDGNEAQLAVKEVNTGVLAAPAALLSKQLAKVGNDNAQGEYYLPDVLSLSVEDGLSVAVVETTDVIETLGVNDRHQLEQLERAYQLRLAEALLTDGVQLVDRSRVDIRGSLQCGQDVFIDANVVFEGDVVLGDDVRIEANCVIKNTVVGAGTRIKAFCHLEDAVVGLECDIGPYARLRPGAELGDEARIGNFVEVKNAKFGKGSKANHLAYVGDADIGDGCNIGAGTITCNYDGANKHKTVLGNSVFIGSNSTLVAPIEIKDGGFVGAGSTITKTVEPDELAISRGKQRNITGWQRPTKNKEK